MAYTIKKAARIQDELTIQDDKGKADLTLSIDLYVDDILQDIDTVRAKLGAAQQSVADLKKTGAETGRVSEAYGALQNVTVELFRLIFGEEQTEALINYYDGRTASALGDLLPYFINVILPEGKTAQAELADRYAAWTR